MVPEGAKQGVFALAMTVPDPVEAGERTMESRVLPNYSMGCSFAEFAEQAADRRESAIGVIMSTGSERQTHQKPGAEARWAYEAVDQVIVPGSVSQP